jgi:hypothetical protein
VNSFLKPCRAMPLCCTAKTDIKARLISSAIISEDVEPVWTFVEPPSTVLGTTYPETKPTA